MHNFIAGPIPKEFVYKGSASNPSSPIHIKTESESTSPDLTPPPTPEMIGNLNISKFQE